MTLAEHSCGVLSPSVPADIARIAARPAPVAREAETTSLFDEDWWLDAAAPGAWDRLRVCWDMTTVGTMVVHVKKRWGLTFLEMPPLTRTMSPRILTREGKPLTQ